MKKRKIPIWGKIMLSLMCVLLILGITIFGFIQSKLNLIQKVDTSQENRIDPSEESFQGSDKEDTLSAEAIRWDADVEVMKDDDVKNILLIGQDAREGEDRARSDTMIICSINKVQKSVKLISLMRDMYVQIPGYSDNRINAAYQFGGMSLLDEVIEKNLGIHIDGNVEANFAGFVKAMDIIGPIDVELTQEEADYLNTNTEWVQASGVEASDWNLVAGTNQLDGVQALSYARIRYVGNSDWERTHRQRTILIQGFKKMKSQSVTNILETANAVLPYFSTDMTNTEMLGYVYTVLSMGIGDLESYRLPVDGTYQAETLRAGMEVLVPDLTQNRNYLKQYIYGEK